MSKQQRDTERIRRTGPERVYLLDGDPRYCNTKPLGRFDTEYVRADLVQQPGSERCRECRHSEGDDLLRDAGAIVCVNDPNAGARVEIRFAELEDAQRLHKALVRMRAPATVAEGEAQKSRSNHFPDDALDRGFPDHISRDGKAYYRDDPAPVQPPAAEGEPQTSEAAKAHGLLRINRKHYYPPATAGGQAVTTRRQGNTIIYETSAVPSPVQPVAAEGQDFNSCLACGAPTKDPCCEECTEARGRARSIVYATFIPPRGAISFDANAAERLVERIAAALPPTDATQVAVEATRGYFPAIIDRADGVQGHYCVGRLIKIGEPFWEYWNSGSWASAATVYVGERLALDALRDIRVKADADAREVERLRAEIARTDSCRIDLMRECDQLRAELSAAQKDRDSWQEVADRHCADAVAAQRELATARADAIRECRDAVAQLAVMDVSVVPGRPLGPQEFKDSAITALESLLKKEGDDGPTR